MSLVEAIYETALLDILVALEAGHPEEAARMARKALGVPDPSKDTQDGSEAVSVAPGGLHGLSGLETLPVLVRDSGGMPVRGNGLPPINWRRPWMRKR